MKLLHVLVCFGLSCAAAENVVGPRGARPVEPATRSEKCASQKDWPFCTDDDWGHKCPSGCRIQGLMDKNDHSLLKKIEKIRGILDQNKAKHHSANQVSKQTYDYLKEKLIVDAGQDGSYYDLAQSLRQRITDMKVKIDRQLRVLAALKDRVKDQVVEMQRLEVDIDIKLRSCKGSCRSYGDYEVDMESYVALDKQINQLDSKSGQSIQSVGTLYVMKSVPLSEAVFDSVYKSGVVGTPPVPLKEDDVFSDVKNVQLILEEEGSPTSPATISKDTGTSYSSSKSSSSATSSSSSSSITELGGHGDGDLFGGGGGSSQPSSSITTKTVSCTKSTRRTVVQTKTGPVEKVEEVYEGGPECQVMSDTKGGMGVLFPSLASSSSSSSSSSHVTHAFHTGGTKGSLTGDAKSGFGMDPFADLGMFLTDAAEDDVPDFQARSAKSTRVERQAGYVGKVCLRLTRQSRDGRRPPCRARSDAAALCSDDDWVSKCPSGCRLQGLISQAEDELERKLRRACEAAKACEEASEKSMAAMTHVYNSNRRTLVGRYLSELKIAADAERLAGNLTALRKRSDGLSRQLDALRGDVRKQAEDLYRTEVDVDVKLRACRGSCRSAPTFAVDHPAYQTLRTDVAEVVNRRREVAAPPAHVARIALRPVDAGPPPSAAYKTIPTVRRELLTQFEDIGQNRLVLEEPLQ